MSPWKREAPTISRVEKFQYEPGDRYILRFKEGMIGAEQAAEIVTRFRAALQLPGDCPVVVLGSDWELTITNNGVKVTPPVPDGDEAA
jgi:hypothetical protein